MQARVDGEGGGDEEDGVAVAGRLGGELGADQRARAGAVVDEHLLLPSIGQVLADQPRLDVDAVARREWDDDANGFIWILLSVRCCSYKKCK